MKSCKKGHAKLDTVFSGLSDDEKNQLSALMGKLIVSMGRNLCDNMNGFKEQEMFAANTAVWKGKNPNVFQAGLAILMIVTKLPKTMITNIIYYRYADSRILG